MLLNTSAPRQCAPMSIRGNREYFPPFCLVFAGASQASLLHVPSREGKMGKKTKLGPTRLGVLLWMLCVGV